MDEKNIEDLIDVTKPIVEKIFLSYNNEYALLKYESTKKYFPDTSLGLPEEGKKYAQIFTPGYEIKIILQNKKDSSVKEIVYHSNVLGTYFKEKKN